MKRKLDGPVAYRATTRDLEKELTPSQLKNIGLVTMRFNQVEEKLEQIFMICTGLQFSVQYEVYTRINGIDGRIAVILAATKALDIGKEPQEQLEECLGKGVFGALKGYRDSVVHARVINAPHGIGLRVDRQAKFQEVLLTDAALVTLDKHLKSLDSELQWFENLLWIYVNNRAQSDKEQFSREEAEYLSRLRGHRIARESLPSLPEFPAEHELIESRHAFYEARIAELLAGELRQGE